MLDLSRMAGDVGAPAWRTVLEGPRRPILSKFVIVAVISLAGVPSSGDGLDSSSWPGRPSCSWPYSPPSPCCGWFRLPRRESSVTSRGWKRSTRQRRRRGRRRWPRERLAQVGGFTAGAAGFASESGLAPALGTGLPDPAARPLPPHSPISVEGTPALDLPETGSASSKTGHSRAVTPIGPVRTVSGSTQSKGDMLAVTVGTTMRRSSPVPTDDGGAPPATPFRLSSVEASCSASGRPS